MRQGLLTVALGLSLLSIKAVALAGVEEAAPPTAAGVWQQVDDDGKVGALVTISEEQGVYVGRLSQLFPEPGDEPNPICTECPGDKHNLPILGLVFIEGMKQSGLDYDDGTILDPETGQDLPREHAAQSRRHQADGARLYRACRFSAGARSGTGSSDPAKNRQIIRS